jgi:2-polyprenyl-6-methoxyphenol hydroxylase-like FAD-dependent oxidoreductase
MSSRLRREAGIEAPGTAYPHRLVSFELPQRLPGPAELSAYATDRGMRLVYPLPRGRTRLYVQVRPGELRAVGRDGLPEWARGVLAGTPALRELAGPLLASLDRRNVLGVWRFTAPALTAPGLALVGDAAHCVHPMAAQGANTAIGDADRLAAHLADAPGADGADEALRGYADERGPALAHIDRTSHNAARMITMTSRTGRLLGRRAARRTGANPRLARTIAYNMSGLGVIPLTPLDRFQQFGLLPDRRSHLAPRFPSRPQGAENA